MDTRLTRAEQIERMLTRQLDERIAAFIEMNFLAEKVTLDDVVALPQRKQILFHGQTVNLTATQFDLCMLLLSRPMTTFSRSSILDCIGAGDIIDRSIDTWIKRIRIRFRKIDDGAFDPIVTRYKLGYHWNSESKPKVIAVDA